MTQPDTAMPQGVGEDEIGRLIAEAERLAKRLHESATFIADQEMPTLDKTGGWSNLRHAAGDCFTKLIAALRSQRPAAAPEPVAFRARDKDGHWFAHTDHRKVARWAETWGNGYEPLYDRPPPAASADALRESSDD